MKLLRFVTESIKVSNLFSYLGNRKRLLLNFNIIGGFLCIVFLLH